MNKHDVIATAEPPLDCQAELLDDMADLCEYWKRNRSKGRTSSAIRRALVMLAADIARTTEPVPNAKVSEGER